MFCHIESAHAVDYPFSVTTSSIAANGTFTFNLSPKGTFYVDCGTGGTLSGTGVSGTTITKSDTTKYTYTCTYSSAGTKTIRFGGMATAYNTDSYTEAIRFYVQNSDSVYSSTLISSISGNLSTIFPNNGTAVGYHPIFYYTFRQAPITSIPATLFSGYTSGGVSMFYGTFYNCTSLTSIPETLFNFGGNNVSGQSYMFDNTFAYCTRLQSIPANLFQRVTSSALYLFYGTFQYCEGLLSIPETLFNFGGNNVSGQNSMFSITFKCCYSLQSIPENLFRRVTSAAMFLFSSTFIYCYALSGYIPPSTFAGLVANNHPTANYMWSSTFFKTQLATSCPAGTTQYITGYESSWDGKVSCQPNTYTITYACGSGGGNAPTTNTSATYYSDFTPAENTCIAPTGYHFSGWLVSGTSYVISVLTFKWIYTENKTFTAQYTANAISMKWDGSYTTPSSCTYGSTFVPPTPDARPGYVFAGWKVKTVNP